MRRPRIQKSYKRFPEELAREYWGYVGKAMDYVYEELLGRLNKILEETDPLEGD